MFRFIAFYGITYYSYLCLDRDLAARNCLVTPDLSVKIGDYGTGIETFKVSKKKLKTKAIPVTGHGGL
jgi:hypothetical protein